MTWEWVAFTLVAGTFVLVLAAIFAMVVDKSQRNRVAREEARARSTVEELQEALEAERKRVTEVGGARALSPYPASGRAVHEEAAAARQLGLTVEQLRAKIDLARTDPKD